MTIVIAYDVGQKRFNYRVAGIAYRNGAVLLQRLDGDDNWFLPGGRIEMLETATAALAREIGEEFGVEPQIGTLLWVVENFFTLDGRNFHELGLYFTIELPETVPTDGEFKVVEPDQTLWNRWVPLAELAHQKVVPAFLKNALQNPPDVPTHIVNVD
jgi:ADP-ribose pyrophosphatase YjhB (NUDIX family)